MRAKSSSGSDSIRNDTGTKEDELTRGHSLTSILSVVPNTSGSPPCRLPKPFADQKVKIPRGSSAGGPPPWAPKDKILVSPGWSPSALDVRPKWAPQKAWFSTYPCVLGNRHGLPTQLLPDPTESWGAVPRLAIGKAPGSWPSQVPAGKGSGSSQIIPLGPLQERKGQKGITTETWESEKPGPVVSVTLDKPFLISGTQHPPM